MSFDAPVEGHIELIDPERSGLLLDEAALPRTSTTITPTRIGADLRDSELVLDARAPLIGASRDFFAGFSG